MLGCSGHGDRCCRPLCAILKVLRDFCDVGSEFWSGGIKIRSTREPWLVGSCRVRCETFKVLKRTPHNLSMKKYSNCQSFKTRYATLFPNTSKISTTTTSYSLHLPITRRLRPPPNQLPRIRRHQTNTRHDRKLPPKTNPTHIPQIKIPPQKRDTAHINSRGAHNTRNHDPVPSRNLHGHHNKLVDDEHGEGDADHLLEDGELRGVRGVVEGGGGADADEELGEALDHGALVDGDEDPDEKALCAEGAAELEFRVQLWIQIRDVLVNVAVEDEREDGHHGVDGRVADEEEVAVECVWLEGGGNGVDGLADGDDEAAVDDELGELGAALVGIAAVPDEELYEVAELLDGEVGGEGGLPALLSDDSDADVCGLDHADVVAAVADAAHALLGVVADEVGDVGFLRGGAAAGDDGGELDGNGDEFLAVVGEQQGEGFAVDEETGICLAAEEGEGGVSEVFAFHW
jgi:hypothetical protein